MQIAFAEVRALHPCSCFERLWCFLQDVDAAEEGEVHSD